MRAIAERFAPVLFHRQAGTAEQHRFDYPTVFDFDGDWIGNNNWEHAADPKYALWSYVYYSVLETEEHYFIHYAVYHPRDWSVVQDNYRGVLDEIQQKYKDILNGTLRNEMEFNHENDLEGALVIVEKHAAGGPRVVAVETLAHNHMLIGISERAETLEVAGSQKSEPLELENGRPMLYVESQKHGIHPWAEQKGSDPIVVMRYGKAVDFSDVKGPSTTYDLVPIYKTLWAHARITHTPDTSFGTVMDFGERFCEIEGAQKPACAFGTVGAAFRGDVARPNAAETPWAWIDKDDPDLPTGAWFFDPAVVLERHFRTRSTGRYLYHPYLGIDAASPHR